MLFVDPGDVPIASVILFKKSNEFNYLFWMERELIFELSSGGVIQELNKSLAGAEDVSQVLDLGEETYIEGSTLEKFAQQAQDLLDRRLSGTQPDSNPPSRYFDEINLFLEKVIGAARSAARNSETLCIAL